jgi:hypothetical protein
MKMGKVSYLSDLHFDHTQWRSELAFWDYELDFMTRLLAGLIEDKPKKKVLAKAEHFQNAFTVHREQVDVLKTKIRRHEEQLANIAQSLPSAIDKKHFHDHSGLRERFYDQRKLFRQLKDEFFLFLEKQMGAEISIL